MTATNHRKSGRWGRRKLLQALGLGAACAPFIPLLDARGETDPAPRRLILVYTPHGTLHKFWNPTGTETDFVLPELLAPLAPYQHDNLIVLKGMRLNGQGGAGPHTRGMPLLFTGSEQLPGDKYKHGGAPPDDPLGWGGNVNASIDQVIAQGLAGTTPLHSLHLGYQVGGVHVANRMSFTAPDTPTELYENPQHAYDQLFGLAALDKEAYERLKAKRISSMDVVRAELEGLRFKVGSDERPKIESHLAALDDIETALVNGYQCEVPPLGEPIDHVANESSAEVLSRHIQLIAAALRCDLTRVVTLQVARGEWDANTYPWIPAPMTDFHHAHTHNAPEGSEAEAYLRGIRRYYAEKIRELADALAAVPEGDGTMLDNTMIVWGTEVGHGQTHQFTEMPFVVVGGKTFLNSGRFVTHQDVAHHRLLVGILHAMGQTSIDNYGENDVDVGSGPLPGLLL
ncbi:Protein of unknown function [Nannocystis exedens]|uniref:Tat (Twin-arginine translocation) pathway signal sequence n=1 Tax=Nannocystis exedens TaxID=54 RepID=A0A1I1V959_9BACT|nr:DUF1552 domain-containing protein [Nannocystis exedens]PCC72325.1 hypothetical protein NAEX_05405 [Nannocystis exedens]SFD77643.1 Protein of unknown function [Nannocystis exedens]